MTIVEFAWSWMPLLAVTTLGVLAWVERRDRELRTSELAGERDALRDLLLEAWASRDQAWKKMTALEEELDELLALESDARAAQRREGGAYRSSGAP